MRLRVWKILSRRPMLFKRRVSMPFLSMFSPVCLTVIKMVQPRRWPVLQRADLPNRLRSSMRRKYPTQRAQYRDCPSAKGRQYPLRQRHLHLQSPGNSGVDFRRRALDLHG